MENFTFSVYSNGFLCFYRYIYAVSFSPPLWLWESAHTHQSLSRFSLQKYLSKLNLELQKLCAECSAVLWVECVFMFKESQQKHDNGNGGNGKQYIPLTCIGLDWIGLHTHLNGEILVWDWIKCIKLYSLKHLYKHTFSVCHMSFHRNKIQIQ